MTLLPLPPSSLVESYQEDFREDAHVIAAAIEAGANYLITLDRRLIERVTRSDLPLQAKSPGAFIEEDLATHPSFSEIR
jgi:predicted nucleic acid-binding protein